MRQLTGTMLKIPSLHGLHASSLKGLRVFVLAVGLARNYSQPCTSEIAVPV